MGTGNTLKTLSPCFSFIYMRKRNCESFSDVYKTTQVQMQKISFELFLIFRNVFVLKALQLSILILIFNEQKYYQCYFNLEFYSAALEECP